MVGRISRREVRRLRHRLEAASQPELRISCHKVENLFAVILVAFAYQSTTRKPKSK